MKVSKCCSVHEKETNWEKEFDYQFNSGVYDHMHVEGEDVFNHVTEEMKSFIRDLLEEEKKKAVIEYDNKLIDNDSCYRMPGKWGNIRKKALKSFGIEEPIW